MVVCLIFLLSAVNNSFNWDKLNKQQKDKEVYLPVTGYYHPEEDKEKEVYLFATGYYHPEENQDLYATGSYEEDLELNGRGITTSGKKVERGHVAVDPSVIPLGTEFYTEEHGILKAEDTGRRIKGQRIDIFTGNGKIGLIEALKINGWLKLKILRRGDHESLDVVPFKTSNPQHPDTSPRNQIQ